MDSQKVSVPGVLGTDDDSVVSCACRNAGNIVYGFQASRLVEVIVVCNETSLLRTNISPTLRDFFFLSLFITNMRDVLGLGTCSHSFCCL